MAAALLAVLVAGGMMACRWYAGWRAGEKVFLRRRLVMVMVGRDELVWAWEGDLRWWCRAWSLLVGSQRGVTLEVGVGRRRRADGCQGCHRRERRGRCGLAVDISP